MAKKKIGSKAAPAQDDSAQKVVGPTPGYDEAAKAAAQKPQVRRPNLEVGTGGRRTYTPDTQVRSYLEGRVQGRGGWERVVDDPLPRFTGGSTKSVARAEVGVPRTPSSRLRPPKSRSRSGNFAVASQASPGHAELQEKFARKAGKSVEDYRGDVSGQMAAVDAASRTPERLERQSGGSGQSFAQASPDPELDKRLEKPLTKAQKKKAQKAADKAQSKALTVKSEDIPKVQAQEVESMGSAKAANIAEGSRSAIFRSSGMMEVERDESGSGAVREARDVPLSGAPGEVEVHKPAKADLEDLVSNDGGTDPVVAEGHSKRALDVARKAGIMDSRVDERIDRALSQGKRQQETLEGQKVTGTEPLTEPTGKTAIGVKPVQDPDLTRNIAPELDEARSVAVKGRPMATTTLRPSNPHRNRGDKGIGEGGEGAHPEVVRQVAEMNYDALHGMGAYKDHARASWDRARQDPAVMKARFGITGQEHKGKDGAPWYGNVEFDDLPRNDAHHAKSGLPDYVPHQNAVADTVHRERQETVHSEAAVSSPSGSVMEELTGYRGRGKPKAPGLAKQWETIREDVGYRKSGILRSQQGLRGSRKNEEGRLESALPEGRSAVEPFSKPDRGIAAFMAVAAPILHGRGPGSGPVVSTKGRSQEDVDEQYAHVDEKVSADLPGPEASGADIVAAAVTRNRNLNKAQMDPHLGDSPSRLMETPPLRPDPDEAGRLSTATPGVGEAELRGTEQGGALGSGSREGGNKRSLTINKGLATASEAGGGGADIDFDKQTQWALKKQQLEEAHAAAHRSKDPNAVLEAAARLREHSSDSTQGGAIRAKVQASVRGSKGQGQGGAGRPSGIGQDTGQGAATSVRPSLDVPFSEGTPTERAVTPQGGVPELFAATTGSVSSIAAAQSPKLVQKINDRRRDMGKEPVSRDKPEKNLYSREAAAADTARTGAEANVEAMLTQSVHPESGYSLAAIQDHLDSGQTFDPGQLDEMLNNLQPLHQANQAVGNSVRKGRAGTTEKTALVEETQADGTKKKVRKVVQEGQPYEYAAGRRQAKADAEGRYVPTMGQGNNAKAIMEGNKARTDPDTGLAESLAGLVSEKTKARQAAEAQAWTGSGKGTTKSGSMSEPKTGTGYTVSDDKVTLHPQFSKTFHDWNSAISDLRSAPRGAERKEAKQRLADARESHFTHVARMQNETHNPSAAATAKAKAEAKAAGAKG